LPPHLAQSPGAQGRDVPANASSWICMGRILTAHPPLPSRKRVPPRATLPPGRAAWQAASAPGFSPPGSKPYASAACHAGSHRLTNGPRYDNPEIIAKSNAPDFP